MGECGWSEPRRAAAAAAALHTPPARGAPRAESLLPAARCCCVGGLDSRLAAAGCFLTNIFILSVLAGGGFADEAAAADSQQFR